MTDVVVVVGGQYGSEAKGAVTAYLASDFDHNDAVIRVAGPNAGHTAYDSDGREWKLRAVPVAAVVSQGCQLHIAAGSEIDLDVLASEVRALEDAGHNVADRLVIHPAATILEPKHQITEGVMQLTERLGSTGKGIGAARADRVMRNAATAWDLRNDPRMGDYLVGDRGPFNLKDAHRAVVEGTQGYGLGLHTRNYPQVTSSDCRAIDFLAMAGISPWDHRVDSMAVIIVARCFPIRVAGNSGPLKGETSWEELGLEPERTTVTNKVRRVGDWDPELLEEAIRANGGGGWNSGVSLAVTMVDQRFPECTGVTSQEGLSERAVEWLDGVETEHEIAVDLVGTSPTTMFPVDLT